MSSKVWFEARAWRPSHLNHRRGRAIALARERGEQRRDPVAGDGLTLPGHPVEQREGGGHPARIGVLWALDVADPYGVP